LTVLKKHTSNSLKTLLQKMNSGIRKLMVSIIFSASFMPCHAQKPVFQWAKSFLTTELINYRDLSNGRSIGVDPDGNVYTVGLFMHGVDFDPGPEVYSISAGGRESYGIYVSKLSPAGDFIWAKQLPVLVDWSAIEMAVDKNGNVYITSTIGDPADMDPGPAVQMMTPIGSRDAFVVKLDSDGNLLWARQFGGPGDTVPYGTAIDIDQNGNVIACGAFNNTVDFDPGPGTHTMRSTGNFEGYIVKLSSDGNLVWAKKFGDFGRIYGNLSINDVKCDAYGNIYTTGTYSEPVDFDPGPSTFRLPGSGGFVAKLDPNGNFLWAKKIGSSENNQYINPTGLDLDSKGNVYTIGSFSNTQDFDGGAEVYNLTSIESTFDPYLLKMDKDGNFVWAKNLGGDGLDYGTDLVIDNSDNIYTVSLYNGNVDFDPGPAVHPIDNLYDNSVISRFDENGNFLSATVFDKGIAIRKLALDNVNNVAATGFFSGEADFDPGPAEAILSGAGDEAPFVMKLGPCKQVTTASLNVISCKNYTLNNVTYDSTGIYKSVIPNSYGCDSIIILNLTINRFSKTVNQTICEGESFYAGGILQSKPGIYTDSLKTVDGCDSIVTTTLLVNPKPRPDLGVDQGICEGQTYNLSPGAFASYLWQDNSSFSTYTCYKTGTYWVKVTDSQHCSAIDSIIINGIYPASENFLESQASLCENDKLIIRPAKSFSAYLWSDGEESPTIQISRPGMYWLEATDENGCTGTDSIMVSIKKCLAGVYFPNAFTPNGDGRNDYFKALFDGNIVSFNLCVFDRFGEPVFKTSDASKGWDGMKKGVASPAGIFVWQCFYQLENQRPESVKGIVTLVR